jgi:cardiolipin synthase
MRKLQIFTIRFNYRLHRKQVIIDGGIGYIGGFNVGDQYLGKFKKFGYWRDTIVKINGWGARELQTRFITDWNATSIAKYQISRTEDLFAKLSVGQTSPLQIASSGPDNDLAIIKNGYLKMFSIAKSSIIIQTPYFVPDQSMLEALVLAIKSGIDVKLMIPNKPDHPFVYRATQYYASEMIEAGGMVYRYDNGFLHTKIVIIDDRVVSIGSANLDIRSFDLNFEANAFIYDQTITKKFIREFNRDVSFSKRLTKEDFENQGMWLTFKQKFSRLLSPIL